MEQLVRYGELRYPELAGRRVATAKATMEVRAALPDIPLVASSGISTGMDTAKAVASAADVVAVARPLLASEIESVAAALDRLHCCTKSCASACTAAAQPTCQPCAGSV